MFRLIALAIVFYLAYAHHACIPNQGRPCHDDQPLPPVQEVYIQPLVIPELDAAHEFLVPSRSRLSDSNESGNSRERCPYRRCRSYRNSRNRCRELVYVVPQHQELQNYTAFMPYVQYDRTRFCDRAIVSCGGVQSYLITSNLDVLNSGIGFETMLKCRRTGRWTAKSNGAEVGVSGLACFVENPQPAPSV